MEASISSEGLAVQAYLGDDITTGSNNTVSQIPIPRYVHPRDRGKYDDTELRFVRLVGRRHVPMVNPEDIHIVSDKDPSFISHSGLTMVVRSAVWEGQAVAVKGVRTQFSDKGDETSRVHAHNEYKRAMFEFISELQILSRHLVRQHRNIVKLLAVSFDVETSEDGDPEMGFASPVLLVELADQRFPDLGLYMDRDHHRERSERLPFEVAVSFISDIADGLHVLHSQRIVHGDLKPGNILIFPDARARAGLMAKISDFGSSGIGPVFNGRSVPIEFPEGGTPQWMAPECFLEGTSHRYNPDNKSNQPSRDLYSFGLLAAYIALDGQSPKSYVEDLLHVKFADGMISAVKNRLALHYGEHPDNAFLGELMGGIVEKTLSLYTASRTQNLSEIRHLLCQDSDLTLDQGLSAEPLGDGYDLFPATAHDMICERFYATYWKSPPSFRARIYESFKRRTPISGLTAAQAVEHMQAVIGNAS